MAGRRSSLKQTAFILTLLLLVPLGAATYFIADQTMRGRAAALLDAQLTDEANHLQAQMPKHGELESGGAYREIFSGRYWQVIDGDGALVMRSRSLWDFELPHPATAYADIAGPAGQILRVHHQKIDGTARTLIVAQDRAAADALTRDVGAVLLAGLAALLALVLAAVLFVVWRITQPLADAADEAEAMASGTREALNDVVPRELLPLVQAVNSNVEARSAILARSRLQAANLAHALKTPLAVLATKLGDDAELAGQVDEMRGQIDRSIRRARIGAGGAGTGAAVLPIAQALARTMPRLYDRPHLEIDISQVADLTLPMDEDDLHDLLGNLMENAVKWAAGRVRVVVGETELRVEDDGPGIAQADRARVLQSGVRLDESTPGTGLGLALVVDIAEAYQAQLSVEASEWGGTRICLSFHN